MFDADARTYLSWDIVTTATVDAAANGGLSNSMSGKTYTTNSLSNASSDDYLNPSALAVQDALRRSGFGPARPAAADVRAQARRPVGAEHAQQHRRPPGRPGAPGAEHQLAGVGQQHGLQLGRQRGGLVGPQAHVDLLVQPSPPL